MFEAGRLRAFLFLLGVYHAWSLSRMSEKLRTPVTHRNHPPNSTQHDHLPPTPAQRHWQREQQQWQYSRQYQEQFPWQTPQWPIQPVPIVPAPQIPLPHFQIPMPFFHIPNRHFQIPHPVLPSFKVMPEKNDKVPKTGPLPDVLPVTKLKDPSSDSPFMPMPDNYERLGPDPTFPTPPPNNSPEDEEASGGIEESPDYMGQVMMPVGQSINPAALIPPGMPKPPMEMPLPIGMPPPPGMPPIAPTGMPPIAPPGMPPMLPPAMPPMLPPGMQQPSQSQEIPPSQP